MRLIVSLLAAVPLALTAFSSSTTPSPTPALPSVLAPTAAPTSAPRPSYSAMRQQLLIPLRPLITATRDKKTVDKDGALAAQWLEKFNAQADMILPVIDKDLSKSANV